MSCCNENKPIDVDTLLANLPQAVLSPNDPRYPLASALRNALPLGAAEIITVNDDGSLEYKNEPPLGDIAGFVRDSQNPRRFIPLWPHCTERMVGVRLPKDGPLVVKMVCSSPEAEQHQKFVTPQTCINCPVRARKNPAQPEG